MKMDGPVRPLTLLPPHPDACPECAREHHPADPHDAESLYYQVKFHGAHGRWPTWADALAHCDDETRAAWAAELAIAGVIV